MEKVFRVHYKVEARYVAEVYANSPEEAQELADKKFSDADFGEASDIDGVRHYTEDENGQRYD